MNFLSETESEDDFDNSVYFKSQVYEMLQLECTGNESMATSGYVGEPCELSESQPLFLIIDYYDQISEHGYEERVVRLWPGIGHEERFVHLRGLWATTKLSTGDPAFVIGTWTRKTDAYESYTEKLSTVVSDSEGYIVILPHVLIQGTRLAASQECERKSFLMDLLPPEGDTEIMLKGTVVHELIQALMFGLDPKDLDVKLDNILRLDKYSLYSIGHSAESFKAKCMDEYMPMIRAIGESLNASANPRLDEREQHVSVIESLPPYGCKCLKEEESLWSFQWGVKGKIDVTLEYNNKLFPLELKSGSCPTSPRDPHVLQLSAYIFMMKEKYKERAGGSGALFYAKNNMSFKIDPKRVELVHVIIKRNRIAHAIAHGTIPGTASQSFACKRGSIVFCNGMSACAFLEDGQVHHSPIHREIMANLEYRPKPHHHAFYKKWEDMLLDEMYIARNSQTSLWLTPLEKRVTAGRALAGLTAVSFTCSIAKFECSEVALSKSSISTASYVMFTRSGVPPIVGRGMVISIAGGEITVEMIESSIREKETNICIDLWESTSSVDICRSNLMSLFATEGLSGSRLRELVVDMASPKFGPLPDPSTLNIPKLNTDQMLAIRTAWAAKDYMLLLGMPGTGKTTTLASMIKSLADKGEKILIASYTHTAVDNLCLKLAELGVGFIRIGRAESVHPEIVPYTLDSVVSRASDVEDIARCIDSCQILASTCLGFHHPLISSRVYDTCVVDEASQINVPTVLGPLSRAKRFILVGDHYQLSPIKKYGTDMGSESPSLFRILCEAHPHAVVTLRTQYRMNNHILKVCNALVYDFRMRTGSAGVGHATMRLPRMEILSEFDAFHRDWITGIIAMDSPAVVVNTDDVPLYESKGQGSKLNHGEASVTAMLTIALILAGIPPDHIGIISPYRAQVIYIREAIARHLQVVQSYYQHFLGDINELKTAIECHTVDKFQGRDKECIIFSCVKSNRQFKPGNHITDWQRLNVAVTRAKRKFILIGSSLTVSNSPFFARMLSLLGDSAMYRLPSEIDQVNTKPFTANSVVSNPHDE